MGKRVKVIIGAIYEVVATVSCRVSENDDMGLLICVVEPRVPQSFVASSEYVWVSDEGCYVTRAW